MTRGELAGLCRARERLREVHDERLSIGDVAREAAFRRISSSAGFARSSVKRPISSTSAHAWSGRRNCSRSDYSVTDVCMEVGFSSLGSFSDLFARRIGVAPSAFRRRIFKQGIPAAAFEVDNIDEECGRLKQHGVVFVQEPTRMGPVTIAVCADTCGNLVQLYSRS